MHLVFLVNAIDDLVPKRATTVLAHEAARRGHAVLFAGVEDLGLSATGRVTVRGRLGADRPTRDTFVAEVRAAAPTRVELGLGDVLMMRTNPPRDPSRAAWHEAALDLARLARSAGVVVLNDPDVLLAARSKLDLLHLPPSTRPETALCGGADDLAALLDRWGGRGVLKPLQGTRGEGVRRVSTRPRPGWRTPAEAAAELAGGPLLAQEYLPDAPEGDTRILVLQGRVLRRGAVVAAFRRRPGSGEWRSNIHLGGHAEPADWTPGLDAVATAVARQLGERGVFLAGIDVVGEQVVEVNVFAPGGLGNVREQTGVGFAGAIVDAVEARRARDVGARRVAG